MGAADVFRGCGMLIAGQCAQQGVLPLLLQKQSPCWGSPPAALPRLRYIVRPSNSCVRPAPVCHARTPSKLWPGCAYPEIVTAVDIITAAPRPAFLLRRYFLFTHIDFDIKYNDENVIEINVSTDPQQAVDISDVNNEVKVSVCLQDADAH